MIYAGFVEFIIFITKDLVHTFSDGCHCRSALCHPVYSSPLDIDSTLSKTLFQDKKEDV